jgi:MFS transporter, OFA family, oxalate/formate antiporter
MEPDGASLRAATDGDPASETALHRDSSPDITARQAFRSLIFWNLICAMTCRSVAFTTVTTHFIPMMVWKGRSQTEASVLLAAFAIFNLPTHFLLGWIADFVNKPKLVTLCLFLGVVAVLPMLWSDSVWALWFFAILYSVLDASIPVFWASVGDFFGRKSFGAIRGNMNLFYTWGAILGPYAAGLIYDRTHSYAIVFTAITVSLLISTALTALLIKPWSKVGTESCC